MVEVPATVRAAFELSPFGVDSRLLESALFDRVRDDAGFAEMVEEVRGEAWRRVLEERRRLDSANP
jgi:hypothetical protein